jgi:hypothetical protein
MVSDCVTDLLTHTVVSYPDDEGQNGHSDVGTHLAHYTIPCKWSTK